MGSKFKMGYLFYSLIFGFYLFSPTSATFSYHLSPKDPHDPESCISYSGRLPMPKHLTICMRYLLTKHRRVNPHFFQIGSINTTGHVAVDGLMFGIYNHVPWFSMVKNSRQNLTSSTRDIQWYGFDKIEKIHYNNLWRHICIAMDFAIGRVKVVDDGKVLGEIELDEINTFANLMNSPVKDINMGCLHSVKVSLY